MDRKSPSGIFKFGEYELNLSTSELRREGVRIPLQRQPLAILALLLERPGDLVLRDEIRSKLWQGDVFVDFDHSINRSINKLREALQDPVDAPHYIETVPGRGYRFIGNILTGARKSYTRIAVLPIENATGNPENDYLADGITEALIDALGQSCSGHLSVIALASVLRFRRLALPVARIADELAVDRVIAGRLRQTENGLRIRLELVDVHDHSALWVSSYRLGEGNDFEFCDEACKGLAASLEITAPSSTAKDSSSGARDITEARQSYLRGRYFWNQRTTEAIMRAIDYFHWATEKDPGYVPAYAALAESYIVLTSWGVIHPKEAISIARENALKALAIDGNNAECHVAMAWAKLIIDSNWKGAELEFQTAISLNPSNPLAFHWYAYFLMANGATSQSLDMNRRALDVDPLSIPINSLRGWLLFCAGRYDEAAAQCRKTAELEMNHPAPHGYLSMIYEKLGRLEDAISEARQAVAASNGMPLIRMLLARIFAVCGHRKEAVEILSELETLSENRYVCGYYMALVYSALNQAEETLSWLDRGCDDGEAWTYFAGVDPRFSYLRADSKFIELLGRMPLGSNLRKLNGSELP
jgi:adenylate cyclase